MSRIDRITLEHVEFIPDVLETGVLYVSDRYQTASHLCCCGCGMEVVTPLNPVRWQLREEEGAAWLYPSIGNSSFECRSHYWIQRGKVVWAKQMSPSMIAAARYSDQIDAEQYFAKSDVGLIGRILRGLGSASRSVLRLLGIGK